MRYLTLLLFLIIQGVSAETTSGNVIRVVDGDTLIIIDANKEERKIRLVGIDAPERKQAHYETSRQNLAKLALTKVVVVEWYKHDRYGRLVGKVVAESEDIGLAQIRAGQAWWFRRYAHEQTIFDRSLYERVEIGARIDQRGLWKTGKPMPPWEWRAAKGAH